jgi:hypothetical protein
MMKSCPLWLNAFADLLRFLVLSLRSESALAAENLFLRKQLAFYKERKIRPRRTTHPARLTLLWLSHWFNWRSALTVVTPSWGEERIANELLLKSARACRPAPSGIICHSRRPRQPATLAAISAGQPFSRITLMSSSPVTSAL